MKLANVPITMLGGDLRELELAKTLLDYEVDLRLVGFPPMSVISRAKHFADAVEAVRGAKFVLGPMSNTDMDGRIFNRLDQLDPIDLVEVIKHLPKETYLLIGVAKPIIVEMASKHQIKIIETAEIDDIAILNSIPTAEGAIQLAMEELPITIHSSKCLVVGYGRCGMTLARSLSALGAKVTVASRKAADIARIIEMGYTPLPLADLYSQVDFCTAYLHYITYFDLFFRTVPDNGGFAIAAGLEQVINYIETLKFSNEDIEYLRSRKLFSEDFLEYLKNFKFSGDIWAVPEGTPVFPREPILTVRAPAIEAQFIETFLLLLSPPRPSFRSRYCFPIR